MGSNATKTKALVITINYKNATSTVELIRSLSRLRLFSELAVRIVDNYSGDDSVRRIQGAIADLPNVVLLESRRNRGYFGAARFAYDRYLSESESIPDWTIVCNNDVIIQDAGFLERLFSRDPQRAAAIGPRLISLPLQLEQNPFLRVRPGWWKRSLMRLHQWNYLSAAAWNFLSQGKRRIKSWWAARFSRESDFRRDSPQPAYAIHGAFFIFGRKYFQAGGFLDDRLFLYGEEFSVAEICRSLGLTVYYDPTLVVLHNEHRSIGKRFNAAKFRHHQNGLRYILKRYWISLCANLQLGGVFPRNWSAGHLTASLRQPGFIRAGSPALGFVTHPRGCAARMK